VRAKAAENRIKFGQSKAEQAASKDEAPLASSGLSFPRATSPDEIGITACLETRTVFRRWITDFRTRTAPGLTEHPAQRPQI
jgi:hypothetical protein